MIIKMTIIKNPRKSRKCDSCYRFIQGKTIYMFGMAEYGDKPYSIWLHPECVTNSKERKRMYELEALQ